MTCTGTLSLQRAGTGNRMSAGNYMPLPYREFWMNAIILFKHSK